MLSRSERLPVQFFYREKSRLFKVGGLALRVFSKKAAAAAPNHSRFGVLIGARIFPRAVIRNKIKRTIFNAISRMKKDVPLGDYLIVPQAGAAEIGRDEAVETLKKLFERV